MRPSGGSRSAALARAQAHLSRQRVPRRGWQEGPTTQTPTFGDLISSSRSDAVGSASLEETAPSAGPRSRFLKQKTQTATAGEQDPAPQTGHAISFKESPSTILKKVAQIESKFQGQKTRAETKRAAALEDELSWTESIQKVEQMPESFGYLKTGITKDAKSRMKTKLLPGDKAPTETSPLLDKHSLSSPRRNAPSPELSRPVSRSIIRSLNELFSEAADTQSEASASSNFRVNIFSLDELVPAVASKEEEEEEATTAESTGEPGAHVLIPPVAQSTVNVWNSSNVNESPEEESNDPGDTDISEQLSYASAALSSYHNGRNSSDTDYSEDFEPSPSSATAGETEAESAVSSARHSSPSYLSSHASQKRPRRSVQDAAVQTSCSFSTPQDLQSDILPIGQSPGGRRIETLPAASRFLSLDVLEAMSTYSPATSALNDVLKQNVLLVRQFAEANRRLYLAVVASLEEERFHYHTLEEAKQYHQSPQAKSEHGGNVALARSARRSGSLNSPGPSRITRGFSESLMGFCKNKWTL